MIQREMWAGSVFVVEWDLTDPDGAPVVEADVTGTIDRGPGQSAGVMVVDHGTGSNTWRASYAAPAAGRYGYRLTATIGELPAGAVAGEFYVNRDTTGADPIETDPATDVGMMRLLVTDLDEAFPILTDVQYAAFLTLEGGNVKRGAAAALEAIATSEVLRSKKITTQDLSVDGPAVADDLRKRAALLRGQAAQATQLEVEADTGFGFDSVPYGSRSFLAGW